MGKKYQSFCNEIFIENLEDLLRKVKGQIKETHYFFKHSKKGIQSQATATKKFSALAQVSGFEERSGFERI